ncbi:MAG: RluA family pseudouridine synthase [Salinivirgaceae bacterium]|nr:RluA family pseudouridine synthase [Salinivirgaceae bacterium]MDD4746031.1 RluA family pseudouridine synthase [Salinivirgaceae bacterium]MDY0279366.1 RluA family pseudouridine synthase [Salinivirgaceae bacterium]
MESNQQTNPKGKDRGLKVEKECILMDFLQLSYPEKSRNSIKSLLKNKRVFVDGHPVSQYNYVLKPGKTITFGQSAGGEKIEGSDFTILFEDEHVIVVDKRAGILSIGTDKEKEYTVYSMLSSYVKQKYKSAKIFIVHRLDRETSGVMVFAKTEEAKFLLQQSWDKSIIKRTYIAMVEGVVKHDFETIKSYLWEDKNYVMHSTDNPNDGIEAITNYKVLKRSKSFTMLEVELDTGRKNQIRIHMKTIDHPILGDKKYGAKTNPLARLGLHANYLVFKHPITGYTVTFQSPTPRKFTKLLEKGIRS